MRHKNRRDARELNDENVANHHGCPGRSVFPIITFSHRRPVKNGWWIISCQLAPNQDLTTDL